IRSFTSCMRSLIKIDGAHLKGRYLGTNFLAIGMDANNQIIPLDTGVSHGETVETWSRFMTKLKECISEVPNMAIISDRHYAISIASMVMKTCKSYLVSDFEKSIADIREVRPEAYRKLIDAGFKNWSRAYCPANRYNYMTSNFAESINSITKTVRKVPITMLMDYYRDLLQRWHFESRYDGEDELPTDELSRWAATKVYRVAMFVPCLGVSG
ncbi:transposase, MuDR, MULE transposase domain protein, partial [Tanacetum coccineum]